MRIEWRSWTFRSRIFAIIILYAALVAASTLYISFANWWTIATEYYRGLGLPVSAAIYGMFFWAIVGGGVYSYGRLDAFGRRVFLGLVIALSLLLILFWPGVYDADSFMATDQGRRFRYNDWLGLTPLVIQAVLQHLPWLGAVTWFQVVFFSLAAAYACQCLKSLHKTNLAPAAMIVLLLVSMPLLYQLMLVSRETWLAIVSLFLVAECAWFFRDDEWTDGRTIGRMFALGVLSYWLRSEAALSVLLIAAVVALRWGLFAYRRRSAPLPETPAIARAVVPAVCILLASLVQPLLGNHDKGAYETTLWLAPVGDIVHEDEAGVDPKDLWRIYAVVPRDIFQKDWEATGINDRFWRPLGAGRIHPPTTAEDRAATKAAALDIILSHPRTFLEGRLKDFRQADAPYLYRDEIAVQPTQGFIDSPRPAGWISHWDRQPHYGGGLFPNARRTLERLFLNGLYTPLGAFEWAVLPDVVLLVLMIAAFPLVRGYAFGAAVILARFPALFLLVPAPLSKYFAPFEFCLPFLLAGSLASILLRQRRTTA